MFSAAEAVCSVAAAVFDGRTLAQTSEIKFEARKINKN
jgi:hypothetical protein